jgi:hypothetical protein
MPDYEVHGDLVIPGARDNEVCVAYGGIDELLVGVLHELVILEEDTLDGPAALLDVAEDTAAQADVV